MMSRVKAIWLSALAKTLFGNDRSLIMKLQHGILIRVGYPNLYQSFIKGISRCLCKYEYFIDELFEYAESLYGPK